MSAEELRNAAIHRMNTVSQVLGNTGHSMHAAVGEIRKAWLGKLDNTKTNAHLNVFTAQLARMPIHVGPTTASSSPEAIKKSPIGMMAGRPPPNAGKYPGFASPGADQKPKPPGMTLRADKMPASMNLSDRYNPKSDFTKRVWTTVHEGSHGILGTHDYRTYKQAELPMAHGNPVGKPGSFIEQRKPGVGVTFPAIAERNADSWAGFVMHASEHIRNQSATKIQSNVRGFLARKKLRQAEL